MSATLKSVESVIAKTKAKTNNKTKKRKVTSTQHRKAKKPHTSLKPESEVEGPLSDTALASDSSILSLLPSPQPSASSRVPTASTTDTIPALPASASSSAQS